MVLKCIGQNRYFRMRTDIMEFFHADKNTEKSEMALWLQRMNILFTLSLKLLKMLKLDLLKIMQSMSKNRRKKETFSGKARKINMRKLPEECDVILNKEHERMKVFIDCDNFVIGSKDEKSLNLLGITYLKLVLI